MSHRWSELTSPELEAVISGDPVVILPLGSTEQHGPHLPVSTDTDICVALAEEAAELATERGLSVLVAPAIGTGYSPHHMDFPGTITLEANTLIELIGDVLMSLHHHGVRHVLMLNGHGGNMAIAKVAADRFATRTGRSPVVCTYWHLVAGEVGELRRSAPGGMGHACELETSLQLALNEARVRTDKLRASVVPATNPYHHVEMFASNRVAVYRPFKEYSEIGVIGDPTLANRELGTRIKQAAVEAIVDVCDQIRNGRL
jgi:creatinine amidohydrolase